MIVCALRGELWHLLRAEPEVAALAPADLVLARLVHHGLLIRAHVRRHSPIVRCHGRVRSVQCTCSSSVC
eukprot:2961429-Amphidinium_carterae.1